jgi:hypothetical protein
MPIATKHHRERLAARRTRPLHDARRDSSPAGPHLTENTGSFWPRTSVFHAVDGADARPR